MTASIFYYLWLAKTAYELHRNCFHRLVKELNQED
uniref:Uncharacterized protein n=1 Tax=Siphoviridae sp. ctvBz3 TaxID=2825720 RepID=A0A8S5TXL7_9CAUD|nr:MAG TPA: hypothetical protein [Siphoviridae sp. ctvBz3]